MFDPFPIPKRLVAMVLGLYFEERKDDFKDSHGCGEAASRSSMC